MIVKDLNDFKELRFLKRYIKDTKGVIAGGCFKDIFLGKTPKDIDVFFLTRSDFEVACKNLQENSMYSKVYENDNVVAFKDTTTGIVVELIRKTFGGARVHEKFDFTVTKFSAFCLDFNEDNLEFQVLYSSHFFEDLFLKRLYVDASLLYPVSTFERTLKYAKYGFQPCRETKKKLIEAINQLEGSINISRSLYDGID